MATTNEVNLTLLIKLLKMTSSSVDGEALTAMRKANEQLTKVGGDWETLLRGKVTVIADPWAPAPGDTNGAANAAPQPTNTGWTPSASRRSTPPPQPRSQPPKPQPAPQPKPYTPYTPPPPRPTYTPPPTQTAIVHFTKRSGQWVLKSNEKLNGFDKVRVVRKDGRAEYEPVGTFIEESYGQYLYNIRGKTNQTSASSFVI